MSGNFRLPSQMAKHPCQKSGVSPHFVPPDQKTMQRSLHRTTPCALTDNAGECGVSRVMQKMSKIVGGQQAAPCSWPWQAALQIRFSPTSSSYRLICGATIISPTCILTAAHCIDEDGCVAPPQPGATKWGDTPNCVTQGTSSFQLTCNTS